LSIFLSNLSKNLRHKIIVVYFLEGCEDVNWYHLTFVLHSVITAMLLSVVAIITEWGPKPPLSEVTTP
jgi:hypothetical protein